MIAWPAVKPVLVLKTQPPLLFIECLPASEETIVCCEDLESWGIVLKSPLLSSTEAHITFEFPVPL